MLLHAFDLVRKQVDDITLVIGGGSPNPKPREQGVIDLMNGIIKEKDMADRIKLIGYVSDEDMLPNYQGAEMFILPSKFEPFGMTSQEAMACGVPVVASKFGGIRNTITDRETGMLVDPGNPAAFSAAMTEILKDNALHGKISRNANEMIRNEYSWEAIASRFLDFYNKYI